MNFETLAYSHQQQNGGQRNRHSYVLVRVLAGDHALLEGFCRLLVQLHRLFCLAIIKVRHGLRVCWSIGLDSAKQLAALRGVINLSNRGLYFYWHM